MGSYKEASYYTRAKAKRRIADVAESRTENHEKPQTFCALPFLAKHDIIQSSTSDTQNIKEAK